MSFEQDISAAKARSAEKKLRYPAFASLLVGAGVSSYTVNVATLQTEYFGRKGERHSEASASKRVVGPAWDNAALEAAIHASQRGEIEYPVFMDQIAAAGITSYEARVRDRVVVYEGHGQSYAQAIPPGGTI